MTKSKLHVGIELADDGADCQLLSCSVTCQMFAAALRQQSEAMEIRGVAF